MVLRLSTVQRPAMVPRPASPSQIATPPPGQRQCHDRQWYRRRQRHRRPSVPSCTEASEGETAGDSAEANDCADPGRSTVAAGAAAGEGTADCNRTVDGDLTMA